MKRIFQELNLEEIFRNRQICNLGIVRYSLTYNNNSEWADEVGKLQKLRKNKLFNTSCTEEKYLTIYLTRGQRSTLAQFRTGILPLRIETGRFTGEKECQRTCVFCKNNNVENELHFLFDCNLYANLREKSDK